MKTLFWFNLKEKIYDLYYTYEGVIFFIISIIISAIIIILTGESK